MVCLVVRGWHGLWRFGNDFHLDSPLMMTWYGNRQRRIAWCGMTLKGVLDWVLVEYMEVSWSF